jgi:hypothetical protein
LGPGDVPTYLTLKTNAPMPIGSLPSRQGMSSDDQVRPFHAKDEARGQETADAVAAVLKHAAARDKAAREKPKRKPPPKWLLPLGIQLSVIAVYLLAAPPKWIVVNPIPDPDPTEAVEQLRVAMYLQAQRVDDYKNRHGQLPDQLSDAGSPIKGVEYHKRGMSSYQLVATVGEEALVYDSNQPSAEFAASVANRLSGGS